MSLPLDPRTLPLAVTGYPAPVQHPWDTLCINAAGVLVDGTGRELTITMTALRADGSFGLAVVPAVPQVGGVKTAAATYGANEQTMLQAVYNALRTFGFLT